MLPLRLFGSIAFALFLLAASACGGGDDRPSGDVDGSTADAGPGECGSGADCDGGRVDGGGSGDAGGSDDAGGGDAGSDTDAGTVDDAGSADAGTDAGSGTGDCGDLGKSCSGAGECASGFECDDFRGVCLPDSSRPICGGFAGAMCETLAYPECHYLMSADYGPCLTSTEAECACRELTDIFVCD